MDVDLDVTLVVDVAYQQGHIVSHEVESFESKVLLLQSLSQ